MSDGQRAGADAALLLSSPVFHRAPASGLQMYRAAPRHLGHEETAVASIIAPVPLRTKEVAIDQAYRTLPSSSHTDAAVSAVKPWLGEAGGDGDVSYSIACGPVSELNVSSTIFQLPSGCFFQTVTYLPVSVWPFACTSNVPVV